MSRPASRLIAVVAALGVLAGACGGGDDADPEAFCNLVRNGVGVDAGEGLVAAADYERLLEVAPDDIADTIEALANASRDLREITELDELFDAAFDPEAQAARTTFDAHVVEACDLDAGALPQGRIDSSADLLADLVDYVEANFANETWTSKVRYAVGRDNGELHGVTARFIVDSVGDEPLSVCNALRPWLYRIRAADGPIEVVRGDLTLARSDSPDTNCVAL